MPLSDQIKIVDGIQEDKEMRVTLTDYERVYIVKEILRIPVHMDVNEEAQLIHKLVEKLGYPEVYPRGKGSVQNTVRKCENVQNKQWSGTRKDTERGERLMVSEDLFESLGGREE